MKQIHPYKGPLTSLFFHKAPSTKSTTLSSTLFHQENTQNISSVITMVVFTDICVFCFSIWVLADTQKSSLVWYTSKQGGAHNPSFHSRHFNFVLVSLFLAEHMRHQIFLQCISQGVLCLVSTLF